MQPKPAAEEKRAGKKEARPIVDGANGGWDLSAVRIAMKDPEEPAGAGSENKGWLQIEHHGKPQPQNRCSDPKLDHRDLGAYQRSPEAERHSAQEAGWQSDDRPSAEAAGPKTNCGHSQHMINPAEGMSKPGHKAGSSIMPSVGPRLGGRHRCEDERREKVSFHAGPN